MMGPTAPKPATLKHLGRNFHYSQHSLLSMPRAPARSARPHGHGAPQTTWCSDVHMHGLLQPPWRPRWPPRSHRHLLCRGPGMARVRCAFAKPAVGDERPKRARGPQARACGTQTTCQSNGLTLRNKKTSEFLALSAAHLLCCLCVCCRVSDCAQQKKEARARD